MAKLLQFSASVVISGHSRLLFLLGILEFSADEKDNGSASNESRTPIEP
jgi:hypothetical protein